MRWEYKIASVEEPVDAHVLQGLVDAYAQDGWELGFVTQGEHWLRLFFRIQTDENAEAPEETAAEPVEELPPEPEPIKPLTQRLINVSELGDPERLRKLRGR
jgi:hypothetical protein